MIRVVTEGGAAVEAQPTVNPDLIAHLGRLVELARGGQINTLAFVASGPHHTDRGYAGIEDAADGIHTLGMLARLERLVQERTDSLANPLVEFPEL